MRLALLLIFFSTSVHMGWAQSQNSQRVEPFKSNDPNGRSLSTGIQKLSDTQSSLETFVEKNVLNALSDMVDESYHEYTVNMVRSRDYLRLSMDMMINQNPLYWKAMITSRKDANILLVARICWHILDNEIEKADRLCQLASCLLSNESQLMSVQQKLATRLERMINQRNRLIYQITLQRSKGNKFDAELALNALQRQYKNSPQLLFTAYQLKLTEYDIDQADEIMMNWHICTDTVLKTDRLFPINFPATTLDKLYEVTLRSQINELVKNEKLSPLELVQMAYDALELHAADFAAHIFNFLVLESAKKSKQKEFNQGLYYCFSQMDVIHAFSSKQSISAQNKFSKITERIQQQRFEHDVYSGKIMPKNKKKK